MTVLLLVAAGGTCDVIGGVAAAVALVGTRRPVQPPTTAGRLANRLWHGNRVDPRSRHTRRMLLAIAAAGGVAAWLISGLPVVGAMVAVAIPGAPWLFRVGAAERRAIGRIEAVGEWARRLKDISATGVGLQQALVVSRTTAPAGIDEPVRDLSASLQAGVAPRAALLRFAGTIGDPVCDQVVAALILHLSDRGDRLGEVLGSIAGAASAEVASRREVDARRTQSRFAVRFLTIATVAVLGYGAVRPQYMTPYATPTGQLVMAVLATAFIAILLWVRSLSQPPYAARLLPTAVDGAS